LSFALAKPAKVHLLVVVAVGQSRLLLGVEVEVEQQQKHCPTRLVVAAVVVTAWRRGRRRL
jgi:hypothetical protein